MYAPSIRFAATALAVVLVGLVPRLSSSSQWPSESVGIDRVFSAWTGQSPGCAVGVQPADTAVLLRAYGLADVEHRAANTPTTIFEAGSVAK